MRYQSNAMLIQHLQHPRNVGAPLWEMYPRRPMVSLTFDDGTDDHYSFVFPALVAKSMKGTFGVNTSNIDGSGHLTSAQLREMVAAGMEISSHGHSHANFTTLTDGQALAEWHDSCSRIRKWTGKDAKTFIVPGSQWDYSKSRLALHYFQAVRSGGAAFGPNLYGAMNPGWLWSENVANTDTVATEQARIWAAMADPNNPMWCILLFHTFSADGSGGDYDWTEAKFTALLDWLADQDIDVVTLSEGAAKIGAASPMNLLFNTAFATNGVWDTSIPPTLAVSANEASALPAGTYYVKYTWVTANGETLASPVASQAVGENEQLDVTIPKFPANALSANIYIGTVSGSETKQGNTTTTTYSQATDLAAGDALPAANTSATAFPNGWTLGGSAKTTPGLGVPYEVSYTHDDTTDNDVLQTSLLNTTTRIMYDPDRIYRFECELVLENVVSAARGVRVLITGDGKAIGDGWIKGTSHTLYTQDFRLTPGVTTTIQITFASGTGTVRIRRPRVYALR